MMERLRQKLSSVFRQNSTKKRRDMHRTLLRGSAHNVIVVKAPNDIFSEAIFILRDEYVSSPTSSKAELLRQAKAAANGCAASASIGAGVSRGILAVLTVLLALETIGIFILL